MAGSIEKIYGKKKCQAAFAEGTPSKKLIELLTELLQDETSYTETVNEVALQLRDFQDFAGLDEIARAIDGYLALRRKGGQVRLQTAGDALALIRYEQAIKTITAGTGFAPDGSNAEIREVTDKEVAGSTLAIGKTNGGGKMQFVYDPTTTPVAAAKLYTYLWNVDILKELEDSFCSCTLNGTDTLLAAEAHESSPRQMGLLTYLSHTLGNYMPGTSAGGKGQFNNMRVEQDRVRGFWDLTLMCIKAWFEGGQNPLGFPLKTGERWYNAFGGWNGFIEGNFLQDYVTMGEDGSYEVVPFYEGHSLSSSMPKGKEMEECLRSMNVRIIARSLRMRYALAHTRLSDDDWRLFFNCMPQD